MQRGIVCDVTIAEDETDCAFFRTLNHEKQEAMREFV